MSGGDRVPSSHHDPHDHGERVDIGLFPIDGFEVTRGRFSLFNHLWSGVQRGPDPTHRMKSIQLSNSATEHPINIYTNTHT